MFYPTMEAEELFTPTVLKNKKKFQAVQSYVKVLNKSSEINCIPCED